MKKNKKETPITRSQIQAINRRYLGDEPEPKDYSKSSQTELIKALSWYSQLKELKDARQYLKQYLGQETGITDLQFNLTIGWLARMLNRGAILPESTMEYFQMEINKMRKFNDR